MQEKFPGKLFAVLVLHCIENAFCKWETVWGQREKQFGGNGGIAPGECHRGVAPRGGTGGMVPGEWCRGNRAGVMANGAGGMAPG